MSVKITEVGSLKKGTFIVIDGEPCRIVSIETSKTGKHGHAKARIVAIGFFDGGKRSRVFPTDAKVEVPIIDKRTGMVVSKLPEVVQIMDMETNEYLEIPYPQDEELKNRLEPGVQVEYWIVMGRYSIQRIKSS
ncbi:MAG: translation initiation factor IF-5A [Candidatus Odinarchaeota archaeon]|nr:translation initiation factor IF-5A [Candidatus Odinarchaeota archaeon]